jgi:hypothetical protein
MPENRAPPRRLFGGTREKGRRREFYIEKLHDMYSSSNICSVTKSK